MRAKGLGAKVIVTEVNPIRAIEAVMDGFEVMPMNDAAKIGDFFVTVTGCDKVIDKDDFAVMKDGAILTNAGHFDCEVDMAGLREMAVESKQMRNNIMGYKLPTGQWLCVIAEGRLVNLAAGDGHPAEIMDMSFAIQALSAKYLVEHGAELKEKLMESLESLTEKERSVVLFYYYEELTLKEIANILEVSESRVSQLHTRALEKMRSKLGDYVGILHKI